MSQDSCHLLYGVLIVWRDTNLGIIMLFEKTLRKKRISPFYAEMIAGFIYNEILAVFVILSVLILSSIDSSLGVIWTIIFLSLLFILPLAALVDMLPATKRCFHLMKDKKDQRVVTSDLALFDYAFSFASYLFGGNIQSTFTHIVYKEPCLRITFFNAVPIGTDISVYAPLKLYLLEVHFTYRFHNECEDICEEYNQMVDDFENGLLQLDFGEREAPKGVQVSNIYFYLTYDKVHAFNKLFGLVNPPEFRITTYEKSEVFISIEPIPGREYPPEALECMKKINAMYP